MDTTVKTTNTTLGMRCEVKGEGDPIVLVGGGLTRWKSWGQAFHDVIPEQIFKGSIVHNKKLFGQDNDIILRKI